MDYNTPVSSSMKCSRQKYCWSGLPFPSPGNLPDPGIKSRSPALQADSLPAEPKRKPKNTGVGSLSLLQQILLTQESKQSLWHYRQILYQLSYLIFFFPNISGLNILVSEWFISFLFRFQILYISRSYLLPKMYFKSIYFVQSTIWENTYPTCIYLIEE